MLEIHYNQYCSKLDLSLPSTRVPILPPIDSLQFLCCPYCQNLYKNPMTLPCGHSICSPCCQHLLEISQRHRNYSTNGYTLRQNRIRMGVNSLRYQSFSEQPTRRRYKSRLMTSSIFSLNKIDETPTTPLAAPTPSCSRFAIRSPQCPTCYAPPSAPRWHSAKTFGFHMDSKSLVENHTFSKKVVAPIHNLALATLLAYWNDSSEKKDEYSELKRNTSPTNSSSSSGFEESEDLHNSSSQNEDCCIQKFNIAILGAQGVGKSRLAKTQYLNRLFFGTIEDNKELSCRENDDSRRSDPELQAKFMIEIIDNNNTESDLKESHGVIVAYSITDNESFLEAEKIFTNIKNHRKEMPIILVATKSDIEQSKRVVTTKDGEKLANRLGCPFMEVSAKKNHYVNEAFTELVQLIEKHMAENDEITETVLI